MSENAAGIAGSGAKRSASRRSAAGLAALARWLEGRAVLPRVLLVLGASASLWGTAAAVLG
jgi:hypothetical protein